MGVPALLYELILREIDVTMITLYFRPLAIPYTKTSHFKRDTSVTRV